jgi:hypothetical protein
MFVKKKGFKKADHIAGRLCRKFRPSVKQKQAKEHPGGLTPGLNSRSAAQARGCLVEQT